MKKNLILMIIISLLVTALITFIGYNVTKGNKDYYKLEKDIIEIAKTREKKTVFTEFELLEKKKCTGFVLYNRTFLKDNYKAYIKCDNYKTYNYDKVYKKHKDYLD